MLWYIVRKGAAALGDFSQNRDPRVVYVDWIAGVGCSDCRVNGLWRIAMKLDITTDAGKRIEERLRDELIIWLTTIDRKGTPQPRPVWFIWDGESFLIYTR